MMDPIMALFLVFTGSGLLGWAVWDYFRVRRNQTHYINTKMGKLNVTPHSVCKTPLEPDSPVDEYPALPEHVTKRVAAVNRWLRENPGADLDTAPDFASGGIVAVDGSRLVGEVMNEHQCLSPVDEFRKDGKI